MKYCPECRRPYAEELAGCPRNHPSSKVRPSAGKAWWNGSFPVMIALVGVVVAVCLFLRRANINFDKVRNDNSAALSMALIYKAESQYREKFPERGYACTLAALDGRPSDGPATPESAQLLAPLFPRGLAWGYDFKIVGCEKDQVGGREVVSRFEVIAVPIKVGRTGDRGYCVDQSGVVMADDKGGTHCTRVLPALEDATATRK